jgi:hypothetical protein
MPVATTPSGTSSVIKAFSSARRDALGVPTQTQSDFMMP